jgi:hypothetical protein
VSLSANVFSVENKLIGEVAFLGIRRAENRIVEMLELGVESIKSEKELAGACHSNPHRTFREWESLKLQLDEMDLPRTHIHERKTGCVYDRVISKLTFRELKFLTEAIVIVDCYGELLECE